MLTRSPALSLALLLSVPACGWSPTETVLCPGVVSPAIEVEVLDSVTLKPAAGGAEGRVWDGAFQDSLRVIGWTGPQIADSTAIRMAGAYERPGTYSVEIERQGYAAWRREGVRAPEGRCGVETVRLTAKLRPIGTLPD